MDLALLIALGECGSSLRDVRIRKIPSVGANDGNIRMMHRSIVGRRARSEAAVVVSA